MSQKSNVRVRFAPSPTGFLHVGGARSLLFNYLYAKKTNGTLVLRIEDTDQARSTRESERMIFEDIGEINLPADESPIIGGPFPPYRQSDRMSIYADHAKQLLDRNMAYYCFCPEEELGRKRELALKLGKVPQYDGTCAGIALEDARARLKKGEKAGLRFRAFKKDYILKDIVKGDVSFQENVVGDFFITRTPREDEKEIADGIGMPVYNFCCVIDDHLMGITHVIRGDDHLSNTARQLQIYDAFNWELPTFAHIAMVLGADRQKLSKRNGDSSVHEYLANGYLPQALLNFLVLLGWSTGAEIKTASGHPEIFSMDEMIQLFDLKGLQKSPAVFDVTKLQWMNSQYMRSLPLDEIFSRSLRFLEAEFGKDAVAAKSQEWLKRVVDLVRGECTLLADLPKAVRPYFTGDTGTEPEAAELLKKPESAAVIGAVEASLAELADPITSEAIDAFQKKVGEKSGAKGKGLFMPMRAILTGKTHGPELKKALPLFTKQELVTQVQTRKAQSLT